jgi:hypothetical protein
MPEPQRIEFIPDSSSVYTDDPNRPVDGPFKEWCRHELPIFPEVSRADRPKRYLPAHPRDCCLPPVTSEIVRLDVSKRKGK